MHEAYPRCCMLDNSSRFIIGCKALAAGVAYVKVSLACRKAHARSVESVVRVDSMLGGNTTPEVIG